MRRYHHLGIPTGEAKPGEQYLPHLDLHIVPFDSNPFGIEWMRYGPACPVPELVRQLPHVAFEVDDLQAELAGQEILIAPNSPSPGVTVAFILVNGAPVEFLEYDPQPE